MSAVDPDRREPEALGGGVVVEQTLGDMDDAILGQRKPVEHDREIALVRFVRADLLRRDHPVEVNAEPTVRRSEQVVIAIRQHAETEATLQPAQRLRGVRERGPVLDGTREPFDLVRGRLEVELGRHALQTQRQDLAIRPIRAGLGRRLVPREPDQDVLGIVWDVVCFEHLAEGGAQPGLPIDKGPVAIEGQGVDVGEVDRGRHPRNCSPCSIVGAA